VVAPSANVSGHVSPTTAQHVATDLAGKIDLIVDGGAAHVGLESTIVGCLTRPLLLRPGGLARGEIEAVLGARLADLPQHDAGEQPLAPRMLASHYAPHAAVRLNATTLDAGEALLAFGSSAVAGVDKAAAVLNLSARGDLVEAAANLFHHLRELDARGVHQIAVMPIPNDGLGEAINDRLRRAAV
jgi:L-threonylcarbamoyladenylate synthase